MSSVLRTVSITAFAGALVTIMTAGPVFAQDTRPAIWTGLYAGANAGGGWGSLSSGGERLATSGGIGGVHGGYNWQSRNFVAGIEADYDFSGVGRSARDGTSTASLRNTYFSSVRGRVGYATGKALIFGSLGYGWSNVRATFNDGTGKVSANAGAAGVVFGGGLEYKIMPNISLRGEVLRYATSGKVTDDLGARTKFDAPATEVRAGISYHF